MSEFHYDYDKTKYDNNSRLLFTDTDSLIYEFKLKMFTKILEKKCFSLVIIQPSENVMIIQTNEWLVKQKTKQIVLLSKNLLD